MGVRRHFQTIPSSSLTVCHETCQKPADLTRGITVGNGDNRYIYIYKRDLSWGYPIGIFGIQYDVFGIGSFTLVVDFINPELT